MSDKPTTKTARFKELYKEGKSIAEIARMENTYYSFVHRVIRKYQKETEHQTEPQEEKDSTDAITLIKEGKSVDETMKELDLPEERRSQVYAQYKKYKNQKEAKSA